MISESVIKKITLENFGPYYGRHVVELGGTRGSLVVVHGQNMTGKTSLLNSIRWALYGRAKGPSGRARTTRQLINDDGFREGQRWLAVELEIQVTQGARESSVRIKRQQQAKSGRDEPVADSDYQEHLSVDVDGHVYPPTQYDDWVNMVLPENISQFFLFDGELLDEYEELVREDAGPQARRVKQAIEQILGVPAAKNGRTDLEQLHKETARRYRREANQHSEARDAAARLEMLDGEIDRLRADRDASNEELEQARQDLREYDRHLRRHQELREDAGRLQEIERRQGELAKAGAEKREERARRVRDLWRDALEPRLKAEISRLERDQGAVAEAINEEARTRRHLDGLQRSLSQETCPTCGQQIAEDRMIHLRAETSEINRRLADLEPLADHSRQRELVTAIARLREVSPAGVSDGVGLLEEDLKRQAIETHKLKREAELVAERLRDANPEVVLEYERKSKQTHASVARLEQAISSVDESIEARRVESLELDRKIKEQNNPALRRLTVEKTLLEQGEALFARAVDDLIDELRQDVEREATDVFLQLTTDKRYRGLRINENYGLTVVGEGGHDVNVRSAGAEQVVALALIGALNRLAQKKGPVIMDTPFGRLDPGHRANILRFIPTLGEQIVLLVHGGEVDRERDLVHVADRIGGEYLIEHPSSSRSRVVPVAAPTHV